MGSGLIGDLSEGIIIIDKAFKILYKNDRVNKIFGLENNNQEILQVQDLLIIKCKEQTSQLNLSDQQKSNVNKISTLSALTTI